MSNQGSVFVLQSERRSRWRVTLLGLIWAIPLIMVFSSVNTKLKTIYSDNNVTSLSELKETRRYSDVYGDAELLDAELLGCKVLVFISLSYFLISFVAWRTAMELQLDKDGFITSIRRVKTLFPRGLHEEVWPVDRLQEISMKQSTMDRLLGVGTIHLSFSTFVLNKAQETFTSIVGVSAPNEAMQRLRATIRPHSGMLLVVDNKENSENMS